MLQVVVVPVNVLPGNNIDVSCPPTKPRAADVPNDNDTAFGGILGVDVPFGERNWMFSGAVQILSTDAEPENGGSTIAIDPIVIKAGFGLRF